MAARVAGALLAVTILPSSNHLKSGSSCNYLGTIGFADSVGISVHVNRVRRVFGLTF